MNEALNNRLIEAASTLLPQVRLLKNCLIAGANINYQNLEGETALMQAVRMQYDRVVEYLLKQGANPLLVNQHNQMASELIPSYSSTYFIVKNYELLFAALTNDLPRLQSILMIEGLLDFQTPSGNSALLIAVEQNQLTMVDCLLTEGASLTLTRLTGQGVFDLASTPSMRQLLQTYQALRQGVNYPISDPFLVKRTGFFLPKPVNRLKELTNNEQ